MNLRHTCYLLLLLLAACTQQEVITVPNNDPPTVDNTPAIKIENYVNRLFIDLIGREPVDAEMEAEVTALRQAQLSQDARLSLIQTLQSSTEYIAGDTSYQHAYYQQLYNLAKARCIEGASDTDINDVIGGSQDPETIAKLQAIKDSKAALQNGDITINELFARLIDNEIYDIINMNTFNFVRASYDNLLWRYPTDAEFTTAFEMVEYQTTGTLFGESGSNKDDFVQLITHSREMFEGLIIWVYRQLLSRTPTTAETIALLPDFYLHRDLSLIQQTVMVTDEYAGF